MTNRLAAILALIIGVVLVADWVFADESGLLFLARKFTELIWWVSFWR